MTNTASQYYCAHGDLHFPADNPQMKSMTVFTHRILPEPLSSAISCTPIPNCSSWDHQTPARGNWPFPFIFSSFIFSGLSPWRGAVRGTQVGSQAGREFWWCQERSLESREVQDTSLPRHWKGEAAKPWTTNEFSFSLLWFCSKPKISKLIFVVIKAEHS